MSNHTFNQLTSQTNLLSSINKALSEIEADVETANTHHSNNTQNLTDIETLITTTNNRLPSALTGSGNLKVCLQELGNEGSERLNVDIGSAVVQLPTALTGEGNLKVSIQEDHTHNLSTSANQVLTNSKLDTIATNTANIKISTDSVNLNVDTLESLQGTTNTNLTNILSKNTEAEVHLSNIDTGIDVLEACVGSNKVNVNISSGSMALASGASTEAKQDNVITKLTEIDTAVDTIDSVLDASLVKQTNLETLITSTNSKIDTLDSVLDASLVKQTNLETLITTLDGVQDNVLTKLGEVDAVLDNIKVDTEAIETAVEALNTRDSLTTSLIIDGESISSGGGTHTTGSIEITKRPKGDGKILFLIKVATVAPSDIAIRFLASGDNSNFFKIPLSFQQNENTDTGVGRVATLAFVPRYLKVELTNGNFSSASTCSVHMFI